MANEFVLFTPRLSDASTLSGSSTVLGMPVGNLQTMSPHEVWRSSSLTSVFIQADLGQLWGGTNRDLVLHVFLGWTNFRQALTGFQIRTDDDSDPTLAPDYNSGNLTLYSSVLRGGLNSDFPEGLHLYHRAVLPADTDVRYVRIDITDGSHPDGYFEASRLAIAIENTRPVAGETDQFATAMPIPNTVWTPTRSAVFGSGVPMEEEVEDGERSEGGSWWPFEREAPISTPYRFASLKRSEVREFRSLYASRGASGDVISIVDYMTQEYLQENMIHGFLRDVKTPTWRTGIDAAHEVSFEVESIL